MKMNGRICASLVLCGIAAATLPPSARAQARTDTSKAVQHKPADRDGAHDFDFEIGSWKVQNSRLLHPLTGSKSWIHFDGTSVARKVWDGRAVLLELESDSPAGHSEGLILRLYNPQTHQWNSTFAGARDGTLGQPSIGEFTDGRAEFYGMDQLNGKSVYARSVLSNITPTSYKLEQALSADGGKTWEVNWISVHTRVSK